MAVGVATAKGYKSKVGGAHPRPPSKVLSSEGHPQTPGKAYSPSALPLAVCCSRNDVYSFGGGAGMAVGVATAKGYKSKVGGAHPRPPSKVLSSEGHPQTPGSTTQVPCTFLRDEAEGR